MSIISSLLVELQANTANFVQNMDKANKSLDSMTKALGAIKLDAIANLGQKAVEVGRQLYEFGRTTSEMADQIKRASEITGMSTEQWQEWKYAAKIADVEADQLATGMKFLATNMSEAHKEGAKGQAIFRSIGVDAMQPLGKVMGDVMDKFRGWEDGANKMAIATALFGRAGFQLIPFMNLGREGFQKLAEEAKRYGIILDSDIITKGATAADSFKRLAAMWEAFKIKVGGGVAEGTVTLIDTLIIRAEQFLGKLKDIDERMKKIPVIGGLWEKLRVPLAGSGVKGMEELEAGELARKKGWTSGLNQANKKPAPSTDPFVVLYGQTEAQIKEGLKISQLKFEEWKEQYFQANPTKGEYAKDFLDAIEQARASVMDEGGTGAQAGRDWLAKVLENDRQEALKLIDELERLKWVGKEPVDVMDTGGGAQNTTEGWITMTVDGVRTLIPMAETLARLSAEYARYMKEAGNAARAAGVQSPEDMASYQTAYESGMGVNAPKSQVATDAWRKKFEDNAKMVDGYWMNTVEDMARTWQTGFTSLITKSLKGDFLGGFEDFCNSILNSFIKTLQEMATQYMIWGSIFGKEGFKGGALMGMLGLGKSTQSPVTGYPGTGTGFFDVSSPEGFSAGSGGGRSDDRKGVTMHVRTYVAQVNATDAQSFDRQMERSLRKNRLYATSRTKVL